ncbi:MAG: hypothetical protein ABIJ83_04140 [Patescibacteria group bacterium]
MDQTNEQSIEPVQSSKNIWITIVAIIITTLVVGGGVYAWQKSSLKNTEQSLEQQISVLQNQISQLQQAQTDKNLLSANSDQQQKQDDTTPTVQPPVDNKQPSNTELFSSHKYNMSFNYPNTFYLLDDPVKWNAILISEAPINFPDIGGTSAPISISSLNNQVLTDELNSLESKTETSIIVGGIKARRIEGVAANVYNKSIKNKLLLVVVESKNIVIRGFESPIDRKINFELKTVFDQIVNSVKFE